MLVFKTTTQYRRDIKRLIKQGCDIILLDNVINILLNEKPLTPMHRDHALVGKYAGQRECHIEPDWLLIYAIDKGQLILTATRSGSHAELFR